MGAIRGGTLINPPSLNVFAMAQRARIRENPHGVEGGVETDTFACAKCDLRHHQRL
jgi:hypothetical protein